MTIYTGRYLSHNRLAARARARLADDLASRRANVSGLTVRQAAKLCRVSVSSVKAARRTPSDTLVCAWNAASPAARTEFVKRVGPARIWDDGLAPAID